MVNKTGKNKAFDLKRNRTISDFKPLTITDMFTLPRRVLPKRGSKKPKTI